MRQFSAFSLLDQFVLIASMSLILLIYFAYLGRSVSWNIVDLSYLDRHKRCIPFSISRYLYCHPDILVTRIQPTPLSLPFGWEKLSSSSDRRSNFVDWLCFPKAQKAHFKPMKPIMEAIFPNYGRLSTCLLSQFHSVMNIAIQKIYHPPKLFRWTSQ